MFESQANIHHCDFPEKQAFSGVYLLDVFDPPYFIELIPKQEILNFLFKRINSFR